MAEQALRTGRGIMKEQVNTSSLPVEHLGKACQLRIESAAQLEDILALDQALWVATSAPFDALKMNQQVKHILDRDNSGRLTAGELCNMIRWLLGLLQHREGIDAMKDRLVPEDICVATDEGKSMQQLVKKLMHNADAMDDGVSLDLVRSAVQTIVQQPASSEGVILPEAAEEEQEQQFIADAIAVTGGTAHPRGGTGLNMAQLNAFFANIESYILLYAHGTDTSDSGYIRVMPFGQRTGEMAALVETLDEKMAEYFSICDWIRLDPSEKSRWWPVPVVEERAALMGGSVAAALQHVLLSEPGRDAKLRLHKPVNPRYERALASLRDIVWPVLHPDAPESDEIYWDRSDWKDFCDLIRPYTQWKEAMHQTGLQQLPVERLRQYVSSRTDADVATLIDRGIAKGALIEQLEKIEKLILLQKIMIPLVRNFVSFTDLHVADRRAMFEEGSLIMDGRHFHLAFRVFDHAKHIKIAAFSSIFLLYVDILGRDGSVLYEVVLPVVRGYKRSLMVDKRGIFITVDGVEMDARVKEIVDNPISMKEALIAPFRRLAEVITGRIEAVSDLASKELQKAGTGVVDGMNDSLTGRKTEAPKTTTSNMAAFAGVGVAVAALGSSLAYVIRVLVSLQWWQILGAVFTAVLALMIPTVILAFLKLNRRNLRYLLEGSGWALNTNMRLTRQQIRAMNTRPSFKTGLIFRSCTRRDP